MKMVKVTGVNLWNHATAYLLMGDAVNEHKEKALWTHVAMLNLPSLLANFSQQCHHLMSLTA